MTSISPNQESQNAQQLLTLAAGLISGFLLGYFTHILAVRRDQSARRIKAKDEFMSVIADLRVKMSTQSERDIIYAESIPVIVGAVYRLKHILPDKQWGNLRAVLNDYESQGRKKFHDFEDMKAALFKDRKTTKAKLDEYLERFTKCIE